MLLQIVQVGGLVFKCVVYCVVGERFEVVFVECVCVLVELFIYLFVIWLWVEYQDVVQVEGGLQGDFECVQNGFYVVFWVQGFIDDEFFVMVVFGVLVFLNGVLCCYVFIYLLVCVIGVGVVIIFGCFS